MKRLFGQWTICVSERWTGERSETSLQRGGKVVVKPVPAG